MMDGDRGILDLNAGESALCRLFSDEAFVGNADGFCAPPPPPEAGSMDSLPCRAGHTACYVSPYGEFYPCVQFPLSCGNVRQQRFIDIWRHSEQLKRGPIDLPEGSVELLAVRAWLDLHSLPGSRVPGGKCARTFHGGLREVLCPHRYPVSESSGEKREDLSAASGADSTGSRNRW
jgi:hypothetical protein